MMANAGSLAAVMPDSEPRPGSREAVRAAELEAANINPRTGLATDYLNHFNEPIMLLDMIAAMPDMAEDFLAWQPMSYREHFLASGFKGRDVAIHAYDEAPLQFRRPFDDTTVAITTVLGAVQQGMKAVKTDDSRVMLAEQGALWLKPMMVHAGALIQGHIADDEAEAEPQAEIDIIMKLF